MESHSPNVLLLTVDCFRYDRCGFNGHSRDTTPFLDSLARESYVFDNAYATGPYTPESFPGILAGLHSKDVKYSEEITCKAIPEKAPTLAEHLNNNGYRTEATITNTHLSRNRNFDKGFENYNNIRISQSASMVERRKNSSSKLRRIYDNIFSFFEKKINSQSTYPNPYVPLLALQRYVQLGDWPTVPASEVIEQFQQNYTTSKSHKPIFNWLHFMDLHAPLHPDKVTWNGKGTRQMSKLKHFFADSSRISEIYHSRYSEMYDGVLRYVDSRIENLVQIIKNQGQWDNTILIVTGDHGEALGERGKYDHPRHYLYDELLRVPLLVRIPGEEGNRIRSLFSLSWLHELITEITDISRAPLPATSGSDTHLSGEEYEGKFVLSDSVSEHGYSAAVRDEEHKLVRHTGDSIAKYINEIGAREQLFSFKLDRAETSPINMEAPAHLNTAIDEYSIQPDKVEPLNDDLGQEAAGRLKQLGYIS